MTSLSFDAAKSSISFRSMMVAAVGRSMSSFALRLPITLFCEDCPKSALPSTRNGDATNTFFASALSRFTPALANVWADAWRDINILQKKVSAILADRKTIDSIEEFMIDWVGFEREKFPRRKSPRRYLFRAGADLRHTISTSVSSGELPPSGDWSTARYCSHRWSSPIHFRSPPESA